MYILFTHCYCSLIHLPRPSERNILNKLMLHAEYYQPCFLPCAFLLRPAHCQQFASQQLGQTQSKFNRGKGSTRWKKNKKPPLWCCCLLTRLLFSPKSLGWHAPAAAPNAARRAQAWASPASARATRQPWLSHSNPSSRQRPSRFFSVWDYLVLKSPTVSGLERARGGFAKLKPHLKCLERKQQSKELPISTSTLWLWRISLIRHF